MDHLFVNKDQPELLVYFGAAFLICSKAHLMQVGCIEDLQAWLNQPITASFKKVMTLTFKLNKQYRGQLLAGNFVNNLPLSS